MKNGDRVFIADDEYICIGDHPTHGAMGLIPIELAELADLALPEDIVPADECEFKWREGAWHWL